jgi:hypothetical protein
VSPTDDAPQPVVGAAPPTAFAREIHAALPNASFPRGPSPSAVLLMRSQGIEPAPPSGVYDALFAPLM